MIERTGERIGRAPSSLSLCGRRVNAGTLTFLHALTIFFKSYSEESPCTVVKVLRPFRCWILIWTRPSWTSSSEPLIASAKGSANRRKRSRDERSCGVPEMRIAQDDARRVSRARATPSPFWSARGGLLHNPSSLEAMVLFYRPRSRRLVTRNGGRTTTGETKEEREEKARGRERGGTR